MFLIPAASVGGSSPEDQARGYRRLEELFAESDLDLVPSKRDPHVCRSAAFRPAGTGSRLLFVLHRSTPVIRGSRHWLYCARLSLLALSSEGYPRAESTLRCLGGTHRTWQAEATLLDARKDPYRGPFPVVDAGDADESWALVQARHWIMFVRQYPRARNAPRRI